MALLLYLDCQPKNALMIDVSKPLRNEFATGDASAGGHDDIIAAAVEPVLRSMIRCSI